MSDLYGCLTSAEDVQSPVKTSRVGSNYARGLKHVNHSSEERSTSMSLGALVKEVEEFITGWMLWVT